MTPAALADKLEGRAAQVASLPVVIGFDAFVDEVIQVVGTRTSPDAFTPLPTIADFGQWVSAAAGRSGAREFVTLERTAGGCTVNSGDGLATLGLPIDAFVGVGTPIEPVFADLAAKCRSLHTLGMEPGHSLVYEFQDGKLILCSFSHFARYTPEFLTRALADGIYQKACASAAGIALTSWSVYPHMTACWRYLQQEVFARLTHRPRFFLDLADPASRQVEDLVGMIDALAGFEQCGPTTLSLNGNEANRVARALGLTEASQDLHDLERLASQIRARAGISELGIHVVQAATSATAQGAVTIDGPFCAKPRRSVGAGDRFNAGWFAGGLLGLTPEEQLLLGVAASGFFVREARSGTFPEIGAFLRRWASGALDR